MVITRPVDDDPEEFSSVPSGVVASPPALASAVRQRRADLRMSQEDVRQASGLSVTTISKIEHGDPDLHVQRATMRRLDLALRWPAGTSESWYEGRGGVVEAPPMTDVAALVDELAPLVAAQLRGERQQSVISIAGLPPGVVRALELLVAEVRSALIDRR